MHLPDVGASEVSWRFMARRQKPGFHWDEDLHRDVTGGM